MRKKNLCYVFIFLSLVISVLLVATNRKLLCDTLSNTKGDMFPVGDIYNNHKLKQKFIAKTEDLRTFSLTFGNYGTLFDDEIITVRLLGNNEELYQASLLAKEINGNEEKFFHLDKIVKQSKGNQYYVEVSCENCDKEHKMALFGGTTINKSYPLETADKIGSNTIKVSMTGASFNVDIIILSVSISIIIIGIILYDSLKKLKVKISNCVSVILEFFLSLLFTFFLFKVVYVASYKYNISFIYFSLLLSTILLLLIIVVYRIIHYKKVENLFITLMLPIGLTYLVFMFPNQVADEIVHYSSAYNIQEGDLLDFNYLVDIPSQVVDNNQNNMRSYFSLDNMLKTKSDYKTTKKVSVARYSTVFYAPASVGIFIGKMFKIPNFLGYYLARILVFISYLILTYFALKIIPYGKLVLFIYLFNPMGIHQSISVSADALLNAFSILYISYVLKLFNQHNISKKEIIGLIILNIVIALMKYVYIPLTVLSLILLLKKGIPKKTKKIIFTGFIMAVVLCIGLFVYLNFVYKAPQSSYVVSSNIDLVRQLKFFIKNPNNIIDMFHYTIIEKHNFYFLSFFGQMLSWLNLPISSGIIYIYFATLILSVVALKEEKEPTFIEKFGLGIVSMGIIALIILAMALTWTPVGTLVVEGVQGRYFYPIVIGILLLFIKKNRDMKINNCWLKFSAIVIFVNALVLKEIICYFI